MRKYTDLKLWTSLSKGRDEPELMAEEARRLGYWAFGLAIDSIRHLNEAMRSIQALKTMGYRAFLCGEIRTTDKNWKSGLRGLKERADLASVVPFSLELARRCSLSAPHSVVLPAFPRGIFFDSVCARQLRARGGAVEVQVAHLFRTPPLALAKILRVIKLELQIARRYGVPIIASSGAAFRGGMMDPIVISSVLECLFDLPREASLNAISDFSLSLVQRKGDDPTEA